MDDSNRNDINESPETPEKDVRPNPAEEPEVRIRRFPKTEAEEEPGDEPKRASAGSLRVMAWVLISAVVILVSFLIYRTVRGWNYHSLTVTQTQDTDNPLSSTYCSFAGGVLRYGNDRATFITRKNKSKWEISYDMTSPNVSISGEKAVLFDEEGSTLITCDADGEAARVTTDLPVQKAVVSERGTFAAMVSDGSSPLIRYYSSEGEEISSIQTSMNDPGYPMSMSLSDDGMLLAVAYLAYVEDSMETQICIYNFDQKGQSEMDNVVAKFDLENTLVPEVRYLNGTSLAVFTEDGFVLVEGDSVPEKKTEVNLNSDIKSLFYNEKYIGFVLENDSTENPFLLKVYDLDGKELVSQPFDFTYETVEFSGSQISLYNRNQLCVYGLDGKKKFEGSCDGSPRQFFSLGTRQYVVANDTGLQYLTLK